MADPETRFAPTSVDALLNVIRVQAAEIDRLRDTVPRLEAEINGMQRDLYRMTEERAQAEQVQMQNTLRDAAAPPKVAPSPRPDDPAAAMRAMLDAMLGHPKIEQYAASQAALLAAAARALNAHASKEENDPRVAERDKTIREMSIRMSDEANKHLRENRELCAEIDRLRTENSVLSVETARLRGQVPLSRASGHTP